MDIKNTAKSFRSRNETVSVLNVEVSCFPSYTCPESAETVNLLNWLRSTKYAETVSEIRKRSKEERDKLKAKLPAITPSGTFSRREEAALIRHSGLLQFDIDFQDNAHIANFNELKQEISRIENVAYCGLSTSGQGFWGLVPIAYPERHKQHFEVLFKAFAGMGISLDKKPRNVASLRGYSFDVDGYFNHTAKPLQVYEQAPARITSTPIAGQGEVWQNVEQLVRAIEAGGRDITEGYDTWFSIGCSLASSFAEDGREFFHRISQYNGKYSARGTDYQYDQCLRHEYPYSLGTLFYHCRQAGLVIPERAAAFSMPEFTAPPQLSCSNTPQVEDHQIRHFEPVRIEIPTTPAATNTRKEMPIMNRTQYVEPTSSIWDLDKLESFFASAVLPAPPIQLSQCEVITDPAAFVRAHLQMARAYEGKFRFEPYLMRLLQLKELCHCQTQQTLKSA